MQGLMLKDWAWRGAFVLLGTSALSGALMEHRFLGAYVISPGRYEALFHVAWIVGLLLGGVAAAFDDLCGTGDLLRQRPLSWRAIVRAKQVSCVVVLVAWFILQQVAGHIAYLLGDADYTFGLWHAVPRQWCTMTVAVSACGVGFFAASLPLSWWARASWAGVALVVVHSLGFWLTASERRITDYGWFAVWHVSIGWLLLVLGGRAAHHRRDVDLPWTMSARRDVLPPLVLLGLVAWCQWLAQAQVRSLGLLSRAYPLPFEREGRVELGVRDGYFRSLALVDDQHRPTGEVVKQKVHELERWSWSGARDVEFLRFEAPWWTIGSLGGGAGDGVSVALDPPNRLFWSDRRERGFNPIDTVALQESTHLTLDTLGDRSATPTVILGDAQLGRLWRFDPVERRVVGLALPEGDRYVATGYSARDVELDDGRRLSGDELREVVVGERAVYRLVEGELRPFAKPVLRRTDDEVTPARVRRLDDTLITWTLSVDRGEGAAPFRHEFAPRTATEHVYAGLALATSAVRPPLLQMIAALAPPADPTWQWGLDPLVAAGRRPWLVVMSGVIATFCVLVWRRAAKRIGVAVSARRAWLLLILLLGPFGWLAAAWVERRRAYWQPAIVTPTAPRVVSPWSVS